MKKKLTFPLESARSLEYEENVDRLNQAIDSHMLSLSQEKWTRAMSWFTNAAFLAGNHRVNFRYQNGSLEQDNVVIPPRFADVMSPRLVENRILPAVESNVSMLTGNDPRPVIDPASMSPDDADLARIAGMMLRLLWERPLRTSEKLRQLVTMLSICGTGAIEASFGELDLPTEQIKPEMVEVPDLTTGEMTKAWIDGDQTEWVWRNGLKLNVYSAFHLDVNPDATDDPDSVTWISRTTYEDLTAMRMAFDKDEEFYYPDVLEGLSPTGKHDHPLYWWDRLKDLIDAPEESYNMLRSRTPTESANMVVVRVIDTKPNIYFPLGRTICQIGGRVAYAGPGRAHSEQYADRWHPYSLARFWRSPGRFWGIPLISPLVPLQRRIDAIDCIIRLNRQHLGVGSMLLPKACKVPEGMVGPLPGQHVVYQVGPRGEKPERFPFQPLPADIYEERAQCAQAIDRLAGLNSPSQIGAAPSALRAGAMLDFVQRQNLQSKSAMLLDWEAFLQDLCQNILIESTLNLKDDAELRRRLAVAARNEADLALERFQTLDLGDNIRVTINLREAVFETPEARKETALQYMQYSGGNMTPVERAKIAKILGLDEIEMQFGRQHSRVRRMVERIYEGQLDAAFDLDVDDPQIFSEVLRDELLSERIITAAPEVKEAILVLFERYQEKLKAKAAEMQAQIAAAQAQGQEGK